MSELFPYYGMGAAPQDFPPEWGDPAANLFRNHGVPLDVTITGSASLNDQSLVPFTDADFFWQGLAGTSTGAYTLNFMYPDTGWYSSANIKNTLLVGTIANPFLLWPAVLIKAGQRIVFQFTDTTGSSNTVNLHLLGVKRIKLG